MRLKRISAIALLLTGALGLSACESPENRAAREAQFDGQPLSAVIARIGNPSIQTTDKAVWTYKETTTNSMPVYRYTQDGQAIFVGHNHQKVTLSCTYTALLNAGRVLESRYEGNSCRKFAPKL